MKKKYKAKKQNNHAQMITLMGIILSISLIMISSLSSEISNIEFVVSSDDNSTLSADFNSVKESFGIALNYNLIEVSFNEVGTQEETYLKGDINDIQTAFNQTRDEYFNVLFKHDVIFDAELKYYWWTGNDKEIQAETTVYYTVAITIYLDNGESHISEDVEYSIACTPE